MIEIGLNTLTKKFMEVMNREVDLERELNGKAEVNRVKKNICRKFRVNANEVSQILKDLEKQKKIDLDVHKRKKKRKIKMRL